MTSYSAAVTALNAALSQAKAAHQKEHCKRCLIELPQPAPESPIRQAQQQGRRHDGARWDIAPYQPRAGRARSPSAPRELTNSSKRLSVLHRQPCGGWIKNNERAEYATDLRFSDTSPGASCVGWGL